jgi:hypothetical protein
MEYSSAIKSKITSRKADENKDNHVKQQKLDSERTISHVLFSYMKSGGK